MPTNPNDPAHPQAQDKQPDPEDPSIWHPGLTKREYIAALAMQGLLANTNTVIMRGEGVSDTEMDQARLEFSAAVALGSVEQADALIAELNREAK